jgi:AraC-like DNA-binding protein
VSSPGPAEAWRTDLIRIACCVVGLVGASAAVWYRLRHPLVPSDGTRSARRTPTEEDRHLAERLERLLRDEAIDARPDLRIGDVAARLGQPEYKVSQCISTVLGFPNFNRLINHHRIERAKRLLADPDQGQPILDVAFECGFGSVGPFNRAFREQVGVTPRAFRAASRRLS